MRPETVCFRTKGNHKQGMGDVMGSLALAHEFRKRGHRVHFVIDNDREAVEAIEKYEFPFSTVSADENAAWDESSFDIIIVNQLVTPHDRLAAIRRHCGLLVTLDDNGAAAAELAHLRINPLYYSEGALCHPKYIPLHPVFQSAHGSKRDISDSIRKLLVTMGGSDTYGLIPQILLTLSSFLDDEISAVTIIGPAFRNEAELDSVLSSVPGRFDIFRAVDIETMCGRMLWADMAVSAAGNTLFEMACCGTPCVLVCGEPFEEETAYRMERMGFGRVLGFSKTLKPDRFREMYRTVSNKDERSRQMHCGKELVDGRGSVRIVDAILEEIGKRAR